MPNDVLWRHFWYVSQWAAATEPANPVSTRPRPIASGTQQGRQREAIAVGRVVAPHRSGVGTGPKAM